MFGYHGKIVKIDLGTRDISYNTFDEAYARKYIGGNGFAAKYFYDHVKPETDPFAPENALIFTSGPFCDTPFSGGRGACSFPVAAYGAFF